MGAACGKSSDSAAIGEGAKAGGTLGVMFDRFDKDKKGYISTEDLQSMMRDDKTHFQGKDANHIMEKYGTDGKMTFTNFELWWNSTYTTYNDDALSRIVEEVKGEGGLVSSSHAISMDPIPETGEAPLKQNLAVSRS